VQAAADAAELLIVFKNPGGVPAQGHGPATGKAPALAGGPPGRLGASRASAP